MHADANRASLIGLDWGTSSLRAYLFAASGAVLHRLESSDGVQQVPNRQFREVFEARCAAWLALDPALPVIACGMIGSQQGWREAAYVECPADLQRLAGGLTDLEDLAGRPFQIVPGLKLQTRDGHCDVMRGEETQIFGLRSAASTQASLYLLPGSHSKWVRCEADAVHDFRSFLTGELYAAIARHTIVGRLFPDAGSGDDFDEAAFSDGLRRVREQPEALTAHLFSVRAQGLLKRRTPAELPSFLSGLLIGAELVAALRWATPASPITLIGAPGLSKRYRVALDRFEQTYTTADSDAAALGLFLIARSARIFS